MSAIYDNWERLVDVVLRREHDREIALCSSRDLSSASSDSLAFEIESSSRALFLHEESVSYGRGSLPKLNLSDFTLHRGKSQEIRSLKSRSYEEFSRLTMDFSDLTLHRDKWKEMLDPGERQLLWLSSFLSFFIDDPTGNNCFLLAAAKGGFGSRGATEVYSNSRSFEAAVLPAFSRFDIRCKINAEIFSASTFYAAYLVFKGGNYAELDVSFSIIRNSQPPGEGVRVPLKKGFRMRDDDWMELGIGGFHIDESDNDTIDLCVQETNRGRVMEIIFQGIEFRPLKLKRSSSKPDKGFFSRLRIY